MKPKMIVSLGNGVGSAFELLKVKAASWKVLGCFRAEGEAFARWKAATALLPLGDGSTFPLTIVALPHPSRSHLFGSLAENFGTYLQMREAN